MAREGVPLNVIQRQLGHANLGITSVYLQAIDNSEIIETVAARAAPTPPRERRPSLTVRTGGNGCGATLPLLPQGTCSSENGRMTKWPASRFCLRRFASGPPEPLRRLVPRVLLHSR